MKLNFTDPRYVRCVQDFTGKAAPPSTPLRFALHRRLLQWEHPLLDAEEAPDYFEYPDIDTEVVHSLLGISPSHPIHLVSPPSLRDGPAPLLSQQMQLKNDLLHQMLMKTPNLSPAFSDPATLNNSFQMTPQEPTSPPPRTHVQAHDLSPLSAHNPHLDLTENDAKASHRISRVVQKLKAVLAQKPDQPTSPVLDEKSPPRPSIINLRPTFSSSGKSSNREHQMSCYYSAVDPAEKPAN